MSCSENTLCRGRIELLIGEKMQPVTVVALFEPGNAFIKFDAGETPLYISQQKYGYIPLGVSHIGHATLNVTEPTPAALKDAPNSLYRRPVIRAPAAFIAMIDVDIRPSD
jgi:hypothetical protein